jgi:coenzyme F420-0:L-glutamate ligase
MNVRAIRTRVFQEGENLEEFIRQHISKLKDGSILAVTSKIVALAEGRTVQVKTPKEKEALIKKESEWALQTHPQWWWTEKDGALLVNAGIDDSNADGKLILLPKDSYKAAAKLRKALARHYKSKKLGVVITDSRISPMRSGVTGLAVGYAGFRGVRDYRGKKDIFGRILRVTMTDIADSLATTAALVMGEGAERQPLAIIEDAPVVFSEKINRTEVLIPAKEDMYYALFRGLKKRR